MRASQWDNFGVTPLPDGSVNVSVWAPRATAAYFCHIEISSGGVTTETRHPLSRLTQGVYQSVIADIPAGSRYGFRFEGEWNPRTGLRFNPNKFLLDPYARAISGALVLDPAIYDFVPGSPETMSMLDSRSVVPHSIVVADDFDWEGDSPPEIPWSQTVLYEAHVKGLTKLHPSVPEQDRGTYRGVCAPAVIEHLQHIGVTALELLPVHQFLDEEHLLRSGLTNYWGYNTIGFFAPHNGYASGENTVVEDFKFMVRELHKAGIEVIIDVVYNHTAEGGFEGPSLCFRGINNPDFYRLDDHGQYIDFTGCGNTVNASKPQALQIIMDSLRYWVTEMHVDGFRFDLAAALARGDHEVDMHGTFLNAVQQDPILRKVKLIAEPWDVGPGGYHVGGFPSLWSEWNDRFRDDVRDFWRGATGISHIGWRLSGSEDIHGGKSADQWASVNFVTAHDGFTLSDLVSFNHKHNEDNLEDNRDGTDNNRSFNYGVEGPTTDLDIHETRTRQIRNFLATLYLSEGVPMLLAGDEFHRTQFGNNNGYCQDNHISWIDWELEQRDWDLVDLCATLKHLRVVSASMRPKSFFTGEPHGPHGPKDLAWFGPGGYEIEDWDAKLSCVGMFISPPEGDSLVIVLNADPEAVEFTLPGSPYGFSYTPILDTTYTNGIPPAMTYHALDSISVTARSTLVLSASHQEITH